MQIRYQARFTGHKAAIYALALAREGGKCLSVGGDGFLVSWDYLAPEAAGEVLAKVEGNIFSILWLENREEVLLGDMYGYLYWLRGRDILHRWQAHSKGIYGLGQDSLGRIYSLGGDGCLGIWDAESRRLSQSYQVSHSALRAMAWDTEREQLFVAGSDSCVRLFDGRSWKLLQVHEGAHNPSVFSLFFDGEAAALWSGGRDALLKKWHIGEAGTFALSDSKAAHLFTINDLAFLPSRDLLATASRDKTIRLWRASDCKLLKVLDRQKYPLSHTHSVNALCFSPCGNYLLSAGDDRQIVLWALDF